MGSAASKSGYSSVTTIVGQSFVGRQQSQSSSIFSGFLGGVVLIPTHVENNLGVIFNYSLQQNYPNPFNPTTKIRYQIKNHEYVVLKIYNTLGQVITTLVNEEKNAGAYEVTFNANKLSSGVYFYRMKAGDFIETKKLLLLK